MVPPKRELEMKIMTIRRVLDVGSYKIFKRTDARHANLLCTPPRMSKLHSRRETWSKGSTIHYELVESHNVIIKVCTVQGLLP